MDQHRQEIVAGPIGRKVFRFGAPLAIAMGLQACFNLADMFIIGKLPNGVAAIGALAICDMIAILGTILAQGISNASVGVIGRYFGKQERAAANHAIWTSVVLIGALSLLFGAVGLFGSRFLIGDMVGASGEVSAIATRYLQILVGNSWTIFYLLHLTAIMRSIGRSTGPAVILIGANLLNVFLDVLLVYGSGPAPAYFAWGGEIASFLGIARMEVDGAAWATVIARAAGCLAACVLLARSRFGPRLNWSEMWPSGREMLRLIRIGTPSSVQFMVRISSYLVALSLIARYFTSPVDSAVLAAFGICIRLDTLALFMGMGWAAAAQTFVGVNLGAGEVRRAVSAGWLAAVFNSLSAVLLVVVFLSFAPVIIGFFNDQALVVSVGAEYLRIVAFSYIFLSFAVVLSYALQGATDTVSSMIIDIIIVVGLQIPLMILLISGFQLPRQAIWYTIVGANVLSALVYSYWYRRGMWTSRQV